jgi:hypothetical protein
MQGGARVSNLSRLVECLSSGDRGVASLSATVSSLHSLRNRPDRLSSGAAHHPLRLAIEAAFAADKPSAYCPNACERRRHSLNVVADAAGWIWGGASRGFSPNCCVLMASCSVSFSSCSTLRKYRFLSDSCLYMPSTTSAPIGNFLHLPFTMEGQF